MGKKKLSRKERQKNRAKKLKALEARKKEQEI